MRAWIVGEPGSLRAVERPVPQPGPGEVRVRVARLRRVPHRPAPGRGRPARRTARTSCRATRSSAWSTRSGRAPTGFAVGDRVGIAWLRSTCGRCRCCRRGGENLCPDVALHRLGRRRRLRRAAPSSPRRYAYRLPAALDDEQAAPLLCAGIIGYRALRRAEPAAGRPAGHLRLRRARRTSPPRSPSREGAAVHVLTRVGRRPAARRCELGAASAGGADDAPPEPLDAAILFAPAGRARAGRAAGARPRRHAAPSPGIHLSDIPPLDYARRAVPGAAAAQRHRQHPRATARSSCGWPPAIDRAADRHAVPARPGRRGAGRPRRRPGQRRRSPGAVAARVSRAPKPRSRRAESPDSPWWFARLTVVVCRTHRARAPPGPAASRPLPTREALDHLGGRGDGPVAAPDQVRDEPGPAGLVRAPSPAPLSPWKYS